MCIDKKYHDIEYAQAFRSSFWIQRLVNGAELSVFSLLGEKEQVKPRTLKLVQSVYQVEICQFAVKGDAYGFRGLILSFEGTMQACETLHAIGRAPEIVEDPSQGERGETPEGHASRYWGRSTLPSALPGP